MNKTKILVRGGALTRSGYGEQSRFALRSLRKYEDHFDIYLIATTWGQCDWLSSDDEERAWLDSLIAKTIDYQSKGGTYDISLQVTIPNEFEKLAPVNIGFTAAIECDRISFSWIQPSNIMDKIITVSEFGKSGMVNTVYQVKNQETNELIQNYRITTPIEAIEYPALSFEPDLDFTAQLDNLLTTDFNFLMVCQWSVRKNVDDTIRWFIEQFIDQDVGLLLKVNLRGNSIMDRSAVQQKIDNIVASYRDKDPKCSVYLLHGDLTEQQMTSLYQHPKVKALVSLAHGEGFCLPMFECSLNALPVIAPNWSGYTNFMAMQSTDKKGKSKIKPMFCKVDYDLKPIQPEAVWQGVLEEGSNWAYPRATDFKLKLREVYKEYPRFKNMAERLAKNLKERNEANGQYQKMAEAINGGPIVTISTDDLPIISLYCSVFNGANLIEGYLENITSQSIFDKKIELVLIHPRTSPGFEYENKIIQQYVDFYPNNITYKILDSDPGLYSCWNLGAKLCNGEYIGNANLDDLLTRNAIEKKAIALFTDSTVDLVYSDLLITDKIGETMEKNSSNGRQYRFPEFSFENLKMVNMPHSAPLYRKSLHHKYGYFREDMNYSSDWEMWLRVASKGVKFKKIEGIFGLYCFNPQGVTTNVARFPEKQKEESEVFNTYKDLKIEE